MINFRNVFINVMLLLVKNTVLILAHEIFLDKAGGAVII